MSTSQAEELSMDYQTESMSADVCQPLSSYVIEPQSGVLEPSLSLTECHPMNSINHVTPMPRVGYMCAWIYQQKDILGCFEYL